MTKSPSEARLRAGIEPLGSETAVRQRRTVLTGALTVAVIAAGVAIVTVGWTRGPTPPAVEVALAPIPDRDLLASAAPSRDDLSGMVTAAGEAVDEAGATDEAVADPISGDTSALGAALATPDRIAPAEADFADLAAAPPAEAVAIDADALTPLDHPVTAAPDDDGSTPERGDASEAPAGQEAAVQDLFDPAAVARDGEAAGPEVEMAAKGAAEDDAAEGIAPADGVETAATATPEAAHSVVTVIKRSNLRIEPDPGAPVVAKLEAGSQVTRLDDRPVMGYYNVALDDAVGWIWWLNVDEPPDPEVAERLSQAERQRLTDVQDATD